MYLCSPQDHHMSPMTSYRTQEYQKRNGLTLLKCMIENSLTNCILTEDISQHYTDHNIVYSHFNVWIMYNIKNNGKFQILFTFSLHMIEVVWTTKFPGLQIDSNLNWKTCNEYTGWTQMILVVSNIYSAETKTSYRNKTYTIGRRTSKIFL
jgi:hypothetical protein